MTRRGPQASRMESADHPRAGKDFSMNTYQTILFDLDGTLTDPKIGITSSQCAVLDYLFHTSRDEVSQRDVEKALNLKNPTVTGILKRLDEKGYILCVPNAKDKRKKNIYLTEKAYDIQRRMETDRRKLDRELTRGMTKREVESLTKNLEKLLYNIADP